jgi:hypothetical protein
MVWNFKMYKIVFQPLKIAVGTLPARGPGLLPKAIFLFLTIFILFSIFGIVIGFFLAFNPQLAIELQRRFYAKINWRIEPISMSKEIRNTRLMGGFLIILTIATLLIVIIRNSSP